MICKGQMILKYLLGGVMLDSSLVINAMSVIANRRPVFYSEHDFQATLACQLQSMNKDSTVIVEYPGVVLDETQDSSIDIVVAFPTSEPSSYIYYLIELKYRFRALQGTHQKQNPFFELCDQSCYQSQKRAFLENDLRRIEQFHEADKCYGGCAVFLTNDVHYYGITPNLTQFSLNPDKLSTVNIFHDQTLWSKAGLTHDYLGMRWMDFGGAGFKYLLIDLESNRCRELLTSKT